MAGVSATCDRTKAAFLAKESNVLAIGGLLVCAAVLTLAALVPVFRRSDPPRWTTRGWVGEVVTLAIVCTLALGVGYLGAGAINAFEVGPDYLDLVLLAGVLCAAVVIWRWLSARARPAAVAVAVRVRSPATRIQSARSRAGAATDESMPVTTPPSHRAA